MTKKQEADWRLARKNDILESLRAFYRRYKRPPTSPELGCGAPEERVRELPTYGTLRRYFGTVANAVREAGMTPRTCGDRTRGTAKQRPPQAGPKYLYHTDFLLILPEARAELARLDSLPVEEQIARAHTR